MIGTGRARVRALSVGMAVLLASSMAASANAQDPVELNYWSMWNETEPQAAVIKEAISAFEAANPGTTVSVRWTGRDIRKLIGAALASGEQVDLFDDSMGPIASGQGDLVLPVDDYLDTPAVGTEGKTVRDTIPAALLELFPVDGKAVSVPYQPYAVMFYYNKDQFDQAGITEAPATWADLLTASAALKAAGFAPITTDVDSYTDIFLGYHAQRETGSCDALLAAMADKTGELWRDPRFLAMAQDIAALAAGGFLADGTEGNLWPAGQQMLALGEASMYLNASWLPSEVADTASPDFRWGAFPYPAVTGGFGSAKDTMLGSQALAIPKSSAHPDEAFELIKYFVAPDAQTGFVEDAGVPSANVAVPWPAKLAEAQAAFLEAENGFGWACDLYTQDIGTQVVLPTFTDLLLGKLTPDAFIEKMVADSAAFWAAS